MAVAVHPQLDYAECELAGTLYYVAAGLAGRYPALGQPRRTVKGTELVGLRYVGPFDDLPVQRGIEHRVIPWEEVSAEGRDGFAAAADRDVILALDTTITPDLQRKALARQLVHQVQMMRKEACLNVEDRIRISVDAHGEAAEAIEEHSLYICTETLAVELRCGARPKDWMAREVDLGEARVNLAIIRA